MAASKLLSEQFKPLRYELTLPIHSDSPFELLIQGQKLGRPSKRITLHQINLKVLSAEITAERRQKTFSYEMGRINHLKSFKQVRLHVGGFLYPGKCTVKLTFKSRQPLDDYKKLAGIDPKAFAQIELRRFFPSVDEPEAKASVEFKLVLKDL